MNYPVSEDMPNKSFVLTNPIGRLFVHVTRRPNSSALHAMYRDLKLKIIQ